jgi:hypothetical protein
MALSCIAVGAAFICYNENWSPVKGIYWTIVTTTVSAVQCIVESSLVLDVSVNDMCVSGCGLWRFIFRQRFHQVSPPPSPCLRPALSAATASLCFSYSSCFCLLTGICYLPPPQDVQCGLRALLSDHRGLLLPHILRHPERGARDEAPQ